MILRRASADPGLGCHHQHGAPASSHLDTCTRAILSLHSCSCRSHFECLFMEDTRLCPCVSPTESRAQGLEDGSDMLISDSCI